MGDKTFSKLSDDVVLKIFFLLEEDPRSWARLSCVCKKFSSLISTVCCKSKCISTLPSLSSDLFSLSSTSSTSPGGDEWSSLFKVAVCCPGLLHSGILLDNSDFGLLRELGADDDYHNSKIQSDPCDGQTLISMTLDNKGSNTNKSVHKVNSEPDASSVYHEGQVHGGVIQENRDCETWTLYDDLYLDTVYDNSETTFTSLESTTALGVVAAENNENTKFTITNESETKKRKLMAGSTPPSRLVRSHLASGVWNLSREQGNKLLASRFREDCLYISDWPGCVHMEEQRNYMVFRGVFKNFKRSRVWRTINDNHRNKVDLKCAFCGCKETWDLHSAFCLKRGFGFHDDGEPVVRAYVCDNGHVSGAWTDLPLYT